MKNCIYLNDQELFTDDAVALVNLEKTDKDFKLKKPIHSKPLLTI